MSSAMYVSQTTDTETILAEVLAGIIGVEQVAVESHFFNDLGADSMVMAQFCARARKRAGLPSLSMKEVYRHSTIRTLATALTAGPVNPLPVTAPAPTPTATPTLPPASTWEYIMCATLQAVSVFVYFYLTALVWAQGYELISDGSGLIDVYLRSVLVGGAGFLGLCAFPILAKWVLIGRWKPQQIRIWSLAYVRFWIVKTLVQSNPLVLFVGSPLYVLYLRALGAKIGRDVLILSRHVPVCTDLLTIGDGTVVRKDSYFTGYRAHSSIIETGSVTLGKNVFVGEATVLDIDTSLGDEAQLGHSSALHAGQAVPAGERRIGSPAEHRTQVDYRGVGPANCGRQRRIAYTVSQMLNTLLVLVPLAVGGLYLLIEALEKIGIDLDDAPDAIQDFGSAAQPIWIFVGEAFGVSFVLFFGWMLASLLVVMTVPRLLNLAIKPDKTYPLYGFHYWAQRAISRITNNTFFIFLFGDSSYIVPYLRCLGYNLSGGEQTGSNFGAAVKHENPYLVSIGTGTMAADGLSIINADYSSNSFRVSQASIGAHSFLGNHIIYPSQAKAGDNCLFATKVMVPVDGHVREGVGLLGAPDFEIPRTVERDTKFDHLARGDEFRRRLSAKNKHNIVTMALYLLACWTFLFELIVVGGVAAELYPTLGTLAPALASILTLVLGVANSVLLNRLSTMFRPLQPQYCSIYDPYFWWHERYWKLSLAMQPKFLNGTPFKGLALWLMGVRIGKRVFDDGCEMPEKSLVTIGDNCAFNVGTTIQAHSQEDGTFKSDRIKIGAGCTLGTGAWVHYGVTMGDGVDLAPHSFLMKGEEVPPHACWGGNPAREIDN